MSSSNSGNKSCDDAINKAEGIRQGSVAGATQASIVAAEITFYRAAVKNALANNVSPSFAMQALKELGVTGQ